MTKKTFDETENRPNQKSHQKQIKPSLMTKTETTVLIFLKFKFQKPADCILDFTIDLIKNLGYTAKPTESLIFSPLSVYATLSLARLGATGSTKEEIGRVLRNPEDSDK